MQEHGAVTLKIAFSQLALNNRQPSALFFALFFVALPNGTRHDKMPHNDIDLSSMRTIGSVYGHRVGRDRRGGGVPGACV